MTLFKDKTVWITGASSGYGRAMVQAFSQEGARVIVSARRVPELEQLERSYPNISVLPLDMQQIESFKDKVQAAISAFGQIDILINNAAVAQKGLALDTRLDVARYIMEIDYFSHTELTRLLLPHFIERQSGQIVVVSGLVAHVTLPLRSTYAAAKAALLGYFGCLRAELLSNNIDVTLLIPGAMKTDFTDHAILADGTTDISESQSSGCSVDDAAQESLNAIYHRVYEAHIGLKDESYALWNLMRKEPNEGTKRFLAQIEQRNKTTA